MNSNSADVRCYTIIEVQIAVLRIHGAGDHDI